MNTVGREGRKKTAEDLWLVFPTSPWKPKREKALTEGP